MIWEEALSKIYLAIWHFLLFGYKCMDWYILVDTFYDIVKILRSHKNVATYIKRICAWPNAVEYLLKVFTSFRTSASRISMAVY